MNLVLNVNVLLVSRVTDVSTRTDALQNHAIKEFVLWILTYRIIQCHVIALIQVTLGHFVKKI